MRLIHFKSLPIVVLLLVLICVSCANAGDLLFSDEFGYRGKAGSDYGCFYTGSYSTDKYINAIFATDIAGVTDFDLAVHIPAGGFTQHNEQAFYYVDSDVRVDGQIVGHCKHGYTVGYGDYWYYQILWDEGDPDMSSIGSGDVIFKFDTVISDVIFDSVGKKSTVEDTFDAIGSGHFYFGWVDSDNDPIMPITNWAGIYDPNARHYLNTYRLLYNTIDIYQNESYNSIIITRNSTDCTGFTKWNIYSEGWTFLDGAGMSSMDPTIPISFVASDSFCDLVSINAVSQYEAQYHKNVSNICSIDTYVTNVSGYTRSIYGNIIDGVHVTVGDDDTYSDEVGFYSMCDLSVQWGFWLYGAKSGFYNVSVYVPVSSNRSYNVDLYMIPVSTLDEGEFGGIVYDYCTLKPILGAYVYLFNETADSSSYAYSNKYGFYRFAGMTEGLDYEVSASKDGYEESIIHSFTFNESNYKTKNIWLLPEGGCPEEPIPTSPPTPTPPPTPPPHEWTNEEIINWLRANLMPLFILVLMLTFLWFIRKAGGAKR